MIWRVVRLSPSSVRTIRSITVFERHQRRLLAISTANPNIATLLSTPPTTYPHEKVTAVGWVRTVRKQKRITFLELGDGSTSETLHAVLKPSQAEGLSTGTAVAVRGIWHSAPNGATQSNELDAEEVLIQGSTDENFPIQKKYHSPEYLRTIPHLRLRTPLNAVLARMRSEVDYCVSRFFRRRQFVRLQPPIITSSDCEGAGEVFDVTASKPTSNDNVNEVTQTDGSHFFRSRKYLTVSSQLHLEAFVHEHPKVWALSPSFRAEKSDTPRHVSEFWMLEVEVRTESLDDVMCLVEDMICDLVSSLQDSPMKHEIATARSKASDGDRQEQIAGLQARWATLTKGPWPRVRYEEAIARLRAAAENGDATFKYEPSENEDFHLEHEKWIADNIGEGRPIFVTHYPQSIKPFYMLPSSGRAFSGTSKPTVACFDLLLPEVCEIVGGSLREDRLDALRQSMLAHGIKLSSSTGPGNLDWYLELRKYGSVPHGGFGLGLDRLLGYLAGVENIKDVVQWPRFYGRCDC